MNQKVKLEISSDLEDVTKLSSVLLDETLINIQDLLGLIDSAKSSLRNFNIRDVSEHEKLKIAIETLQNTSLCLSKIDNRLTDIVAIVTGLDKILIQLKSNKDSDKNDNISTG